MMPRIRMGMILFILSEAIFFLLLILAYAYFHGEGEGAAASKLLDPVKTGFFSAALLLSSFTLWRAEVGRRKVGRSRARLWLLATLLLGALFLAGQGTEYADLIRRNVTISQDIFGTTFFTLTGFHGLHVFAGLVILSILLGLATAGRESEPTPRGMGVLALYWHFVDGVWIVIFSMVYLWRYL